MKTFHRLLAVGAEAPLTVAVFNFEGKTAALKKAHTRRIACPSRKTLFALRRPEHPRSLTEWRDL